MYNNKAFCKGLACRSSNLKTKCSKCGILICNFCNFETINKGVKKPLCFNCYWAIDWKNINKDFDEMISGLNKNSDIAKIEKVKV